MVLNWSQQLADLIGPEDEASLASELTRLNDIPHLRRGDELYLTGEWLQSLVDQVPDYIFVKDRKSRFVMANRQVAFDIGFTEFSELLGKTDMELHTHDVGSSFMEIEETVMATKVPQIDQEEFLILPTGCKKWFSSSKFPVTSTKGEVVGIIGICRDITERKKAEILQQGQNRILQEIAGGKPLFDVLETLVLTIEDQLDGVVGSVLLVDESGKLLLRGAAPNLPRAYVERTNRLPVGPAMGSCGTAVHTRQSVFVDDICTHEFWKDHQNIIGDLDMRSCWSVPFFSKDSRVLGTFGLYSREARLPSKHEEKLATEAARLASIAVERDHAERKIRYLAHHDVLTGLPNRQEFKHQLEKKVETSRTSGNPLAVVFVDVDNFKFVNDSFGHTIGDQVLAIIADRIKSVLSESHEAIRFGGDEFVLIAEGNAAHHSELHELMTVLREDITKTIHIGDLSFHVTCSIGAASYPQDAQDAAELLKNADKAMFEAKSSGRDGFKIYEETRPQKSLNKLTLLEEMRTGIENGEFLLEYQPQYNLVCGRIVGAEALVRWQHPVLGRMMPGEFITLAEESGLIAPLGRWVLNEACRQNRAWQEAGLTPITMGVNVSVRQFRDAGLISDVTAALKETGLEAGYLELEVTESLLMQNADQAVEIMERFRQIGLKLAIDDFGTGYSSLAALKNFPLTRLKIDHSFIRDLDFDERDRCIARAIISLGRELGLDVVAEGVETAKQQAFLASCRCETVQGFHFGRPMNADRFGKLLAMTLTPLDAHFGSVERRA
ncbi:EAL domain-containing protein [Labrenzia sp. 011]|uniref:sensor domain-containing protein n=1 Tax=Labrenzia sp. 011 TaxID=2171494 RepID=UPI000D5088F8|nr:EAL domain-containing protein [Labrenzia sp. 011]PVB63542.1 bifunctional diguanylate cyclase/phosphodiesterase [Labrenzia sp. 011]